MFSLELRDLWQFRGSASVSPAVFGVPPNTSRQATDLKKNRGETISGEVWRETPHAATGTVALPKRCGSAR
jgi:hypothetical protein